jgi:hypothetical protein
MLDIPGADKTKLKYKLFMHFILKEAFKKAKELGMITDSDKKIIDIMHDDLKNCTNYPIRKLYFKMLESAKGMGEEYQANVISELGVPILWILYRDTAYRDPFFWMLNEMIQDPDFISNLKQYVKPPEMWYCSNWRKSKESTANLKARGELSTFEMSEEEKIFVPKYQQEKHDRILKDYEKKIEWKKIMDNVNENMKDSKRKV